MLLPSIEAIDRLRQAGIRPQVVGCFLHAKKILFLYKEKYELWELPQGGIDNRETIETAIKREMAEELGVRFMSTTTIHSLIGENQVIFPVGTKDYHEFKTDAGKDMVMKGKKYFFIVIDANVSDLHIRETEYEDYQWLDYDSAIKLSETMYQRGKQRVTVNALDLLHHSGLL
ncbi:MAG: NUDIX hydrolase [Patescibacteria group bacterium]|jgi:8-oxo-dGTP pyrophosphatase MutT (NUDIX family)